MKTPEIYGELLDKISLIKHDKEKLMMLMNQIDGFQTTTSQQKIPQAPAADYESIVVQIAEALDNGFICFLNPDTMEIEQVADEGFFSYTEAEYDEQNEDMVDEYGLNYTGWKSYIRFEPFSREDLLDRIETFIMDLEDSKLKKQLEEFTDTEELLRQFPDILERTGHTEEWNQFKRGELETYVKDQLRETVEDETETTDSIYSLSSPNYYPKDQKQQD